jgi:hypothetical protein
MVCKEQRVHLCLIVAQAVVVLGVVMWVAGTVAGLR